LAKRYRPGYAVRLEAPEWVGQLEAAKELGIPPIRIGALLNNGHPQPAETAALETGVTRASLDSEKRWRAEASLKRKAKRLAKDIFSSV
jgi:hypothetical protein